MWVGGICQDSLGFSWVGFGQELSGLVKVGFVRIQLGFGQDSVRWDSVGWDWLGFHQNLSGLVRIQLRFIMNCQQY